MANVNYSEGLGEYYSRNNMDEVFPAVLSKYRSELNFASVKSCLMIGPGEGQHEVSFIKEFATNIRQLIAVEPDHQSAELLKARLEKSLPGVESQVIMTSIQNWKGLENPVDMVLMWNVLYYVGPEDRKELFTKLHERWLTEDGFVLVVSASRTRCPGDASKILDRLGTPLTAWEDIEADLLEAAFIKKQAHEMHCQQDYSDANELLLRFLQTFVDHPITLDDVRSAIEAEYPREKTVPIFKTFAVFQKA